MTRHAEWDVTNEELIRTHSVATRTISEFTTLRQEMRATAQRVPAGA